MQEHGYRKLIAGVLVGAVVYALTKLAIPIDPKLEQLLNAVAVLVAVYLTPEKETEYPEDPDYDPATDKPADFNDEPEV